MKNVAGSIVLEAIMDGVTIASSIQTAGNYPFIQRFKTATGEIFPDYTDTSIKNDEKPLLYPHIVRSDDATPLTVQTITFKYNGVACTSPYTRTDANTPPQVLPEFQDVFQGEMFHPDYYPSDVKVPALRIIGNLVNFEGNDDNDKFSCSGTVKISADQTIAFSDLYKEFVIQEANDNMYTVWLTVDNAGQFTEGVTELHVKAHIDVDGNLSQDTLDTTKYLIKWYKIAGRTTSHLTPDTNDQTSLSIGADSVDGQCTIQAGLYSVSNTAKPLAIGFIQLTDFTDPFEIQWRITGNVAGYQVRKGGTAIVNANVVRRSDGAVQSGWNMLFVARNVSDGKIVSPPEPALNSSMQITYDRLVAVGRKMGIYANASTDIQFLNTKHQKYLDAIEQETYLMPEEIQRVDPNDVTTTPQTPA